MCGVVSLYIKTTDQSHVKSSSVTFSSHVLCVVSLFTSQPHVSVSSRCLQTSQSSCTPADPRADRRASWSPIATLSLGSQGWQRSYLICGRDHNVVCHTLCHVVCTKNVWLLIPTFIVRLFAWSTFPARIAIEERSPLQRSNLCNTAN